MTRHPAAPSRPVSGPSALQRQLVLMGVLGSLLPLAVLATLYLLAPTPLSEATAQTLRMANRFAAAMLLLNAALTLATGAGSRVARALSARRHAWQPLRRVRSPA